MNFSRIRRQLGRLGNTPVARQSTGIVALIFLGTLMVSAPGAALIALLASSAATMPDATTTLFLMPRGEGRIEIGQTVEVDVNITTKIPVNAIGATVVFPSEALEVVGISKKDSFIDLWTEETSIKEEAGEVHFSGGTTKKEGLSGSGTALTLSLRAKKPVSAVLSFKDVTVYPHDGTGREVSTQTRSLSYTITEPAAAGGSSAGGPTPMLAPSADLDESGSVTLVDLSILTFRMLGSYNPRYDLNTDGSLGLGDISVLLTNLRAY